MLIEGQRPRELHWYHAAPMLFGDWGTSRLYVLGLAFYYTRHASLWFMLAMSLLLIGVGWAYNIICGIYPDGGGVYSSARHRSPALAVIGGLLLCADYLVTAAISALDAFHYLNVQRPEIYALISLVAIGCINYFGPRKSGMVALVIAVMTVILTLILGLFTVPYMEHAHIARPVGSPLNWWTQFTSLILAISGVEAIANMTGLMVLPVKRTAARSIWPVLTEIVILNLVLTVAMLAMPLDVLGGGSPEQAYTLHRDDMLRVMAQYYVGPTFAAGSAIVFALLLLSAANTAITDLVSIQFMMSRDRELPAPMGLLNAWGMPLIPLALATAVPVIVLIAVSDVEKLADLYAIGVVGAVAINLGTCSTNPQVELTRFRRFGMGGLAIIMIAIWITVAYEKPHALIFALSVMSAGLLVRYVVRHRAQVRDWCVAELGFGTKTPDEAAVNKVEGTLPGLAKHIVVATPGRSPVFRFALAEAKTRNAELHVLFVRHVAVPLLGTLHTPDVDVDPKAQRFFDLVMREAQAAGVTVHCSYYMVRNIAKAVVDFAVNRGADAVILPTPQRGRVWRAMKGDIPRNVARRLPKNIKLLIHS